MVKQLARHWAVQAWGGPAEGRPETAVPAESRPEAVAAAAELQELSCAVRRLEALVAGLAEGVKAHAEPAGHAGGGEQPEPGTAEKPADQGAPAGPQAVAQVLRARASRSCPAKGREAHAADGARA